jgi:hypothetical protein
MSLPKEGESGENYSLFGAKKQTLPKTQICLFNYDAKKIGDYDMNGKISKVELTSQNKMFIVHD